MYREHHKLHSSNTFQTYKYNEKDRHIQFQTRVFVQYLKENTATCTMASVATGIPQKNLTRLKRKLEKNGKLAVVCVAKCQHTGHLAQYLTTNPEIIRSLE